MWCSGLAPVLNLQRSGHPAITCHQVGRLRRSSSVLQAGYATQISCAEQQPLYIRPHAYHASVQRGSLRHSSDRLPLRACLYASPARRRRRRQSAMASAGRHRAVTDTTLWAGDAIILLLTQLSSDRLPTENQGVTSILLLTAWSAVAHAKRDYDLSSADYDFWNVRAPVMSAVRSAALTWVLFAPLAVSMYSSLASQHLLKLPAGPAQQLLPAASFSAAPMWLPPVEDASQLLAPELEVIIAALFCVGAWRGVYSAYRTWSNFR